MNTRPFCAIELDAWAPGSVSPGYDYSIGGAAISGLGTGSLLATAETTLRYAEWEYTSLAADTIGVQAYRGLARTALAVRREMPVDPVGRAVVSAEWGDIELVAPTGYFDAPVRDYAIDGRSIRVLRGAFTRDAARGIWVDPSYDTLERLFRGVAQTWLLEEGRLRIPVRDRTWRVELPYLTLTFGGTGGLDGTAEMAGRFLPRLRGEAANISPVLVDPTARIWRYSDGPGEVLAVYERGLAGFANQGNVADLYSGSTSAASYRTDNARALFQLGSEPIGEITLDARGSFPAAGYKSTPFDLARWMLQEDMALGESVIDTASFAALAAACPYVAGWYWPGDGAADGISAMSDVLRGIGQIVTTRGSQLRAVRLAPASGSPVASYSRSNIARVTPLTLPGTVYPPTYRWQVRYGRNWTVQRPDLDVAITPARRQLLAQEWRGPAAWFDGDVRLRHIRSSAPEPLPTSLRDAADAEAVADALGALWGPDRYLYEVDLPLRTPAHDIGDTIEIDFPIGPLDGGALARVVGERIDTADGVVSATVLV